MNERNERNERIKQEIGVVWISFNLLLLVLWLICASARVCLWERVSSMRNNNDVLYEILSIKIKLYNVQVHLDKWQQRPTNSALISPRTHETRCMSERGFPIYFRIHFFHSCRLNQVASKRINNWECYREHAYCFFFTLWFQTAKINYRNDTFSLVALIFCWFECILNIRENRSRFRRYLWFLDLAIWCDACEQIDEWSRARKKYIRKRLSWTLFGWYKSRKEKRTEGKIIGFDALLV